MLKIETVDIKLRFQTSPAYCGRCLRETVVESENNPVRKVLSFSRGNEVERKRSRAVLRENRTEKGLGPATGAET